MVFCTLFNKNYLSRGLALYHSLAEVCEDFKLYVFAFDNDTYEVLKKLNLPALIPVSLTELEDEELLMVKPTRSFAEYCWTSTSSTILWVLKNKNETSCTYLDADLFFYRSPHILLDEMPASASVLITSHNYTRQYDQSALSGKYCVQFMYFRNDENGLIALNWWRDRCIEWCYARQEDGKFGDQKYLDDWLTRFSGVHELQHLGCLAPWNVQQYELTHPDQKTLTVKKTKAIFDVVFFHFHGVKYFANGKFILAPRSYLLSNNFRKYFYAPYLQKLLTIDKDIRERGLLRDTMGTLSLKNYLKDKFLKGHWAYIKRNLLP